jgi:hypothetical protein
VVSPDGDRAWVAEPVVGLQLFDLSAPDEMRLIAQVATPGEPSDVALHGSDLLVADGSAGLRVVDTTGRRPAGVVGGMGALRVRVAGDVAMVTGNVPGGGGAGGALGMGLWAVDVRDPAQPRIRGQHGVAYADWNTPDVAVLDGVVLVTTSDAGLEVVRVVEGEELPEPTPGPAVRAQLWLPGVAQTFSGG